MPRRHTASGESPPIGSPANMIVLSVGAIAPAIMLNSVVLPAPLGPITANKAPSGTSKLTLSTAIRPRKRLLTAESESSAFIGPPSSQGAGRATARYLQGAPQ